VVISFYVAIVILAVYVVFGGVMPRRMMPYVESPMVGIVSMMPGLSANEMETYISKPIEERMTDIRGARYIRSTSQDGLSIVTLEFPYGSDIKKATTDVQSLMNAVQADLPQTGANLKPSWVLPIDPLNLPVLTLSLTGDAAQGWTSTRLRQFAENQVVASMKQVDDVQSVQVYGGEKRQMRVTVDRDKLAAYGFSILDVRTGIDKNSVAAPAGTLTAGPNETGVRIDTLAASPQAVAAYPVGDRGGRTVYIRDVAAVEDAPREQRSGYHSFVREETTSPPAPPLGKGRGVRESAPSPPLLSKERGPGGEVVPTVTGIDNESVEVSVIENPSAGSGPVIAGIMKKVVQIEQDNPGLHFAPTYDNAHFINILFKNTGEELGGAILLCGLVVWLFLGSRRATLISMTTIPVSMAMALLCMAPFGFSLNSSTLIGLLLAIGRLVDDSVIDIHSVERHLSMGKSVRDATIEGITEVRVAVAASTLMLCLALIPLVVCGGITQLMFVGLVYPIIFGLLSSFLVSLTLTAVMAAKILKPQDASTAPRRNWLGHALERMDGGYEKLVLALLRNKATVVAGAVCTIIIGFGFYNFIGSEMMPLADVGQAYAVLEMQPGTSYKQTAEATAAVEKILARAPEIQRVSTEIGTEPGGTYFSGYAMNQINTSTMMITLSDKDERKRDVWQVVDTAREEALRTVPNIRRLQIKEMGSDVMASSAAPVQVLVTGPDLNTLSSLANQVADIAAKIPGNYQVATSWAAEKPTYRIHVDPRRASELGLTPSEVAEQAYYAMGGGLATEFYRLPNVRQDTFNIRYRPDQRRGVDDLAQMTVTGEGGRQAPLKTIATLTLEKTPPVIEHDGLRRSISVMAYYRKDGPPSMDLAMQIITKASAQVNFPPGYGLEMRGDMTQMMDSFARLLKGLGLALLLIFLVLIAQFKGPLMPLQMVLSIPLELSGVFIGLYFAHQAFSSVSIMAVIVLTGMDITTAILMIDQIMRRREELEEGEDLIPSPSPRIRGREPESDSPLLILGDGPGVRSPSPAVSPTAARDGAIALACRDRLRPILMTSLITIVTMAPVAFAPKSGIDAYQPLGTVIVAGLIAGTLLSLLVIPVMHAGVDDIARRFTRRRKSGSTA
jgi:HAE1 family hydrophobic/amphiphilic exporter-1